MTVGEKCNILLYLGWKYDAGKNLWVRQDVTKLFTFKEACEREGIK